MPPKTTKNSKTLSRLSNADESASSPRTPSLASAADSEASEQEYILLSLEEASKSSMVSSSLAPGSIESVDEIANEAGNYFALEMVFPSCEYRPCTEAAWKTWQRNRIGNTNRLPGKLKLWDTLVCLKRYARSKKSDYSSHSKGSSIAYEGCSDSVVRECDCSTGVGDMLRYSADSAFSNTSYLRVSLENPPSSCCNGTVSEIEDKIENGIIACPEEELMGEEESC
ncbi:hypothetical protein NC652_036070 [Populus alba x Populus x berolinensis]|nr:hypothetical protein NC652_036070 [Populus alba x Populus x berolinensis]